MVRPECESCNLEARRVRGFLCNMVETVDGLPVRCVHKGSFDKVSLLKYYLEIFSVAMRGKYQQRNFIDLFAGPGLCHNRYDGRQEKGSSLVALCLKQPFSQYIFVDMDTKTSAVLRERCERHRPQLRERVRILNLDANESVSAVLNLVAQKGSISVAFIDPNGADVALDTIQRLSQCKRLDLIINFSVFDLKRNRHNYHKSEGNSKADRFFGTDRWRSTHRSEWVDLYKSQLIDLGFKSVESRNEGSITISSRRGAPIYHLIYASKHTRGLEFWRATKKWYQQHDMLAS